MDVTRLDEFAADWVAAWNAHDVERILSHYADDVEMSSPYVALVVGGGTDTVRGIDRLRDYWTRALVKRPLLHFDPLQIFAGVNSVALLYRSNVTNKNVIETFIFDTSGRIAKAHAYYAPS